jgi:DNA ligase-1
MPQIVLEVAFDRVQPSARHRSGYALRFPRIARWRHDKSPRDIDTLSRVAALAQTRDGERVQLVDQA